MDGEQYDNLDGEASSSPDVIPSSGTEVSESRKNMADDSTHSSCFNDSIAYLKQMARIIKCSTCSKTPKSQLLVFGACGCKVCEVCHETALKKKCPTCGRITRLKTGSVDRLPTNILKSINTLAEGLNMMKDWLRGDRADEDILKSTKEDESKNAKEDDFTSDDEPEVTHFEPSPAVPKATEFSKKFSGLLVKVSSNEVAIVGVPRCAQSVRKGINAEKENEELVLEKDREENLDDNESESELSQGENQDLNELQSERSKEENKNEDLLMSEQDQGAESISDEDELKSEQGQLENLDEDELKSEQGQQENLDEDELKSEQGQQENLDEDELKSEHGQLENLDEDEDLFSGYLDNDGLPSLTPNDVGAGGKSHQTFKSPPSTRRKMLMNPPTSDCKAPPILTPYENLSVSKKRNRDKDLKSTDLSVRSKAKGVRIRKRKLVESFTATATPKKNQKGETDLHVACGKGEIETVRKIADVVTCNAIDNAGWSPMHDAINGKADPKNKVAIIEVLMNVGADVNSQGDDGNTPLHKAAVTNQVEVCQKLLTCGASPDIRNSHGLHPRDLTKNKDIIKLMNNYTRMKELDGEEDLLNMLEDPVVLKAAMSSLTLYFAFEVDEGSSADLLRNAKISSELKPDVTHIFYRLDSEKGYASFGMPYLYGLARGIPQFNYQWVVDSVAEGKWISPVGRNYEILGLDLSGSEELKNEGRSIVGVSGIVEARQIPKKARQNREKRNPGLFHGITFYLYSSCKYANLTKADLSTLIFAADGSVTNREPNPATVDPLDAPERFHSNSENLDFSLTSHVILYDPKGVPPKKKLYKFEHVKTLKVDWLIDSLCSFELRSPNDYY